MPFATKWKLVNQNAAMQLPNETLDSHAIDSEPIGLALESNLSFGGDKKDDPKLALNIRGGLTVTILNDPTDQDEDGIVGPAPDKKSADVLPPQLSVSANLAYLKYRAESGVKADAGVALGSLVGLEVGGDASAVFADYRVHAKTENAAAALLMDIGGLARFVTRPDDVLALAPAEALAFRFTGSVNAGITVSWSDVFAGQIGTLSRLLGTAAPIGITAKAGASVSLAVSVSDEFLIAFSRVNPTTWRVAVRKARTNRVAPSVDAGIDVGLANPKEVDGLITSALDSMLGAPLNKVKGLLGAASLDALGPAERKVADMLIERLGLNPVTTTIESIKSAIDKLEKTFADTLMKVVTTRVALSFSYEYSRVSTQTSLLQATLDEKALRDFHAGLIKARTDEVTAAVLAGRPGVGLEIFLNQKEVTRSQSWGFTLGLGKWGSIGGKDFKKVTTVRRLDLQNRVQESYLGARWYKGQWLGNKMEWGVDLKADMKGYAAEPLVSDFSFGFHLLWKDEKKKLDAGTLNAWLDSGVVWRVLGERNLLGLRARLAPALGTSASLTVQVTIPNSAVRALLPAVAGAPVSAYAGSLAVAMPWTDASASRMSASKRRQLYAPLWAGYLADPTRALESYIRAADKHLMDQGEANLATLEQSATRVATDSSFAGLTQLNGDTQRACNAFTRGAGILQSSIVGGAKNHGTIDEAMGAMDDLWSQSHHVRAIGVYLLDAADQAGVLGDITRTMSVSAKALDDQVVITA